MGQNSTGAKSRGQEGRKARGQVNDVRFIGVSSYQSDKNVKDKKCAFTLAETLITLVIIGVVAAMTIPSLINKHNESETIAKTRKIFATLGNAMTMVKIDGGTSDFSAINGNTEKTKEWFDTYLKKHLSTTKVCYDTSGCWNKGDTLLKNGSGAVHNNRNKGLGSNIVTAVLSDGSFININVEDKGELASTYGVDITASTSVYIAFDINGDKKPNVVGKDIHVGVYKNGMLVPAFYDRTMEQTETNCDTRGYGCLRLFLQNQK